MIEAYRPKFFDQRSLCPPTGNGAGGKTDPFDRVDCWQKRSAFTKHGDSSTRYRATVVGDRGRLNCSQQRSSTVLPRRAPRGQINHQASNVIATRFFTACIERKLSSVGANLLSNVL